MEVTRIMCEICSKLTIKILERCQRCHFLLATIPLLTLNNRCWLGYPEKRLRSLKTLGLLVPVLKSVTKIKVFLEVFQFPVVSKASLRHI